MREGLGQNQLTPEEIESIWQPYVAFTNAKIGQIKYTDVGLMVRREAEPQSFSYEDPVEGDVTSDQISVMIVPAWETHLHLSFQENN